MKTLPFYQNERAKRANRLSKAGLIRATRSNRKALSPSERFAWTAFMSSARNTAIPSLP